MITIEEKEKNNGINWEAWGFTVEEIPRRKIITASPYDIGSYSYDKVKDAGVLLKKPSDYAWMSLLKKRDTKMISLPSAFTTKYISQTSEEQ